MDINRVINLGHTGQQPLMCSPSELSYRSEPHDQFTLGVSGAAVLGAAAAVGGCTRGGVRLGGYQEVLYRVPSRVQI